MRRTARTNREMTHQKPQGEVATSPSREGEQAVTRANDLAGSLPSGLAGLDSLGIPAPGPQDGEFARAVEEIVRLRGSKGSIERSKHLKTVPALCFCVQLWAEEAVCEAKEPKQAVDEVHGRHDRHSPAVSRQRQLIEAVCLRRFAETDMDPEECADPEDKVQCAHDSRRLHMEKAISVNGARVDLRIGAHHAEQSRLAGRNHGLT